MISDTRHPIERCTTFQEAWNTLVSLKVPCGVITMMSPGVNGGFCFMDGRIVGAFIDETGVKGEQAMMVLTQLSGFTCSLLPYNRESVADDVAYVRDTITTSQPVYENDSGSTLSAASQEQRASTPIHASADPPAMGPGHITVRANRERYMTPFPANPEVTQTPETVKTPEADHMPEPEGQPVPIDILPPPELDPEMLKEASHKRAQPISAQVASTLFRHFAAAENLQDFLAADGKLADAPSLNTNQLKMLDIVRELSDPELFEEQAEVDLNDSRSLTESQQVDLKSVEGVKNVAEFQGTTGHLDFEGLQISDEQLIALGEALAARSIHQQKAEFQEADAELAETGETVLKDFVEPAEVPWPEGEKLPPGLSELVIPEDYQGVHEVQVDMEQAKLNPATALADQETSSYKKAAKAVVDQWKYLAPASVAFICICAYVVPALVRSSTPEAVDKRVAMAQTKILVNDDIRSESPRRQPVESMPSGSVGPIAGSHATTKEAAVDTSDPDPVIEARAAKSQGNIDKAIAILEEALSTDPSAVETRLELIRLYKGKKQFKRARYLAVVGFRADGNTPKQRDDLWKLYMDCTEVKPTTLESTAPTTPTTGLKSHS